MTERKFPGYLFVFPLLWCLLTALPAVGGPDRVWGFIAWRADIFVWLPAWLIVTAMSLAGLAGKAVWLERDLPQLSRLSARFFNRSGARAWFWLAPLTVAVGWGLRSRNFFMGDGWALIDNVRKPFYFHANEPLDFFAHQLFSCLLALLSVKDGAVVYAVLAVLLLPLFLWFLWKISALVRPEKHERTAVFLILMFTGCVQLLLGHVESYTLVNLFICLSLCLGLKTIAAKGKNSLWPITAATVLAALSHLSAVSLLPALIFVWLYQWRLNKSGRSFTVLFSVCAVAALAGLLFFDLPGMTPLYASKTGDHAPFTLLDPRYLWFKLNLLLMLAPSAFLLLPAALSRSWKLDPAARPELYFLMLSAAGPLFFFFGANAMLGLRDWDLLCLPALPITLLAAWLFLRLREAGAGRALWLSGAALAAACQIMAFVWVNTGKDSGVEFLDRMRQHEIYTGSNMLQLGYLFEEQNYLPESLRQYLGITQKEFAANRAVNAGTIFIRLGMPDSTISLGRYLLDRYDVTSKGFGQICSNLSLAYDLTGQPDKANAVFLLYVDSGETPNGAYLDMWVEQLRSLVAKKGYLREGLDKLTDHGQLMLLARLYALSKDTANLRLVYARIFECWFDCGQWRSTLEFTRRVVNREFADQMARQAALECPELTTE